MAEEEADLPREAHQHAAAKEAVPSKEEACKPAVSAAGPLLAPPTTRVTWAVAVVQGAAHPPRKTKLFGSTWCNS